MVRDDGALLENTLEVLQARERVLDAEILEAEKQLAKEIQRYELEVSRWVEAGPEAIMTAADRAAAWRGRRRAFLVTFVVGMSLPLVARMLFTLFMRL